MRVGGHLEAGVRQQEAADVGEARVDVFPDVLQLLVLVLFHLKADGSSGLKKNKSLRQTVEAQRN